MKNVLIIGAGGVGAVTAHKCAQHNDRLGDICLASRTVSKCDDIIAAIHEKNNLKDSSKILHAVTIDAMDSQAVADLITRTESSIVLNVGSVYCNLAIMQACLKTGAHYLDTGVYEQEGRINEPPPWYANYEWKYRDQFAAKGVTGILGIGFDPGVVNVFCAHAQKHLFDRIDTIDIMDVNGGDHGRYFATNFDPETNLREIMEDVIYWQNGEWQTIPCHSRSRTYDFPRLGEFEVYSMGHDEIHSLAMNIPAQRIEFWMGFGERYLQVFNVLNQLGLLSNSPVEIEGVKLAPIKMMKAVLPDPASLAKGYTGEVCIGCLIKGEQAGKSREVFIYSTAAHPDCYAEVKSQAISYTTGVPIVTAALLLANGAWNVGKLVNVEELDPDPFLNLMPEIGISWDVREEHAS